MLTLRCSLSQDFLAANRCVGQYLLAVGEGTAGLGAVTVVAYLERGYSAGFVPTYWALAQTPLDIIIRVTGFVRYRYRMTKAMTMAQFFEMRYSKKLRIYAGFICWISGVISKCSRSLCAGLLSKPQRRGCTDMGIFPGVGARFFINFCNLPQRMVFGSLVYGDGTVTPVAVESYPVCMIILLSISYYFTISGGQIAVVVTDFAQGLFTTFTFVAIVLYLMGPKFDWADAEQALDLASPPAASLYDPFDIGDAGEFNAFYYFSQYFGLICEADCFPFAPARWRLF